MRNCFVPGCDQICKGVSKRRMFSAPKDKVCFDAWMAILPKNRTFKLHDKVCERHFNEEDISTTYDNVINGLVYKIERGRPRLRQKAIPCRNLETDVVPNYRRAQNNRKLIKVERELVGKHGKHNKADSPPSNESEEDKLMVQEEQHLEVEEIHQFQEDLPEESASAIGAECPSAVEEEHLESIEISEVQVNQELFENLYDDIYEVVLPNTLWGVHRCPERSSVFFSYIDPAAHRTTKIVSINSQGQAKILLGNRMLNEQSLVFDINSIDALSEAVAQIDEMKLCPKVFDNEFCDVTLKDGSDLCTSCIHSEME